MNFTASYLFGTILFGAIGMGAFLYGKKQGQWRILVLGIALMLYPYAVAETWMLYAIGAALAAALFVFRD
jgi:hypothetical protein